MEKKMERELDKEAKLKQDAKKLIGHALGKNDNEMDRTVKAWLKNKDEGKLYLEIKTINDIVRINQGQPYTKEYRQLIVKEMQQ